MATGTANLNTDNVDVRVDRNTRTNGRGFLRYSHRLVESIPKTSPRHTLKTGLDARMIRVNVWEARAAGTFNFSPGFTQGPNPTTASSTAGHSIASLLLGTGTANNVLIQNWKNVASQNFYFAPYVQDDWRVNARLTLNLGVRYDYETPRTERFDRMNYFDPDARLGTGLLYCTRHRISRADDRVRVLRNGEGRAERRRRLPAHG